MARPVQIVPSVLPADFARLGEEVRALEEAGADRIQWDVMDGQFVPNLTVGPDVIAAVRPHTSLPFEAHLMVHAPEGMLPRYVEAGCEVVIIHAESTTHLHKVVDSVGELGARAAVALNPATPALAVRHVLHLLDLVLVMTVNPGFGGQRYLSAMEPKVAEVAALAGELGCDVDIEVDGGVAPETIAGAAGAGANVFVAGTALWRDPAGIAHAIADLKSRAEAARGPGLSAASG
ncbi:MAG: rpe [Acidimicrobiales bacterium]|nr:rpe [Acidimicrobiales bacterium]